MLFFFGFLRVSEASSVSIEHHNEVQLQFNQNEILIPLNPTEFQFKISKNNENIDARAFNCQNEECSIDVYNPSDESKIFAYSISTFNKSCQKLGIYTNIKHLTFIAANSDYTNGAVQNNTIHDVQDICLYFGGVNKYVVSLKYDIKSPDTLYFNDVGISGDGVQLVVTDLHSLNLHTENTTMSKYVDILINEWSTSIDKYSGELSVGKVEDDKIISIHENSYSSGIELATKTVIQINNDNNDLRRKIIYIVSPVVMCIILVICGILIILPKFKCMHKMEENSDSDSSVDDINIQVLQNGLL